MAICGKGYTQAEHITWEYFQETIQKKYVGTRYVKAYRIKFIELEQGDETVSKYEAKFLRLSHYAQGVVAMEQDKCVMFENGLRYNLKIQVAPH